MRVRGYGLSLNLATDVLVSWDRLGTHVRFERQQVVRSSLNRTGFGWMLELDVSLQEQDGQPPTPPSAMILRLPFPLAAEHELNGFRHFLDHDPLPPPPQAQASTGVQAPGATQPPQVPPEVPPEPRPPAAETPHPTEAAAIREVVWLRPPTTAWKDLGEDWIRFGPPAETENLIRTTASENTPQV